MRNDGLTQVRNASARWLISRIGDPSCEPNSLLRYEILLRHLKAPAAMPALVKLIRDESRPDTLRGLLAGCLVHIDTEEAKQLALEIADEPSSPRAIKEFVDRAIAQSSPSAAAEQIRQSSAAQLLTDPYFRAQGSSDLLEQLATKVDQLVTDRADAPHPGLVIQDVIISIGGGNYRSPDPLFPEIVEATTAADDALGEAAAAIALRGRSAATLAACQAAIARVISPGSSLRHHVVAQAWIEGFRKCGENAPKAILPTFLEALESRRLDPQLSTVVIKILGEHRFEAATPQLVREITGGNTEHSMVAAQALCAIGHLTAKQREALSKHVYDPQIGGLVATALWVANPADSKNVRLSLDAFVGAAFTWNDEIKTAFNSAVSLMAERRKDSAMLEVLGDAMTEILRVVDDMGRPPDSQWLRTARSVINKSGSEFGEKYLFSLLIDPNTDRVDRRSVAVCLSQSEKWSRLDRFVNALTTSPDANVRYCATVGIGKFNGTLPIDLMRPIMNEVRTTDEVTADAILNALAFRTERHVVSALNKLLDDDTSPFLQAATCAAVTNQARVALEHHQPPIARVSGLSMYPA